jgi:IMP dehydrogenase
MRTGFTYDDVALVPQYNNIESRSRPDLGTLLTEDCWMGIPIVAANMDTVIGEDLADVLVKNQSKPILHRFYRREDEAELIRLVKKYGVKCFMSWGVNRLTDFKSLVEDNDLRPYGVCLDIAHGHSLAMINAIKHLREWNSGIEIIAGNVCTAQGFHDLVNAGATAVKVGIGPGAACTTRKVTGFGVPQFTAVQDCAKQARRMKIPLIADGGIKGSRECVLALAAGASSVMIGSLFANTHEAAKQGVPFRGQASEAFQRSFYGKVKKGTVPEGKMIHFDCDTRPAQSIIDELLGGIRSGMTYGGATTIKELQRKAEFIAVTSSYREKL